MIWCGQVADSPGKASCGSELTQKLAQAVSGSQVCQPLMLGFCSTCIDLWKKDTKKS